MYKTALALATALHALAFGLTAHAGTEGGDRGLTLAELDVGKRIEFRIPAQGLNTALVEFSQQAGLQVVVAGDDVKALRTEGASGSLTISEALDRLLRSSGLVYKRIGESAISIGRFSTAGVLPEGYRIAQMGVGEGARADSPDDDGEDSAEQADVKGIPDILVSASRALNMDIRRTPDDIQPYQVLDSAVIEQSAAHNVEDFLKNHLSMNTTARVSSQYGGHLNNHQSSVNLRGLGTNQTLILVNGRRLSSTSNFGNTAQPNINSIPLAAIERIEVLPSSASAIYGGAAAGGVVNVILKQDYDGGNVYLRYESAADTFAPDRTVSAAYGFTPQDGKTNLFIAAHYSATDPLYNRERPDLLQNGLETILRNNSNLLYTTDYPYARGRTPNITSADGSNLTLKSAYGGGALGSPITSVPVGTSSGTSATDLGAGLLAGAGSFNTDPNFSSHRGSGLLGELTPNGTTTSVLATVRRELTDRFEAFAEFSFSKGENSSRAPALTDDVEYIPASAPTNPFDQDILIGMTPIAINPIWQEYTSRRATAGLLAKLPGNWLAEADYTWNKSRNTYGGLDVAPRAYEDFSSGVLNPLVDTSLFSIGLEDYLDSYGATLPSALDDIGLRAAGPIGRLPAGNATLTVGLGRRSEILERGTYFSRSYEFAFEYLKQKQSVDSLYAEMNVPVVSEANARPGIRRLDFQLAGRTERYEVRSSSNSRPVGSPEPVASSTTQYNSTNPTLGLRYAPIDGLTLRASYGTAFLPPDFAQLLEPVRGDLLFGIPMLVIDPKRGDELVEVAYLSGGNPDAKPTETRNWNLGFILEPGFAPGLRLNVEWFQFKQDNVLVTPTIQQVVDNEDSFSGRVTRDEPGVGETVGQITLVDFSAVNTAATHIEGFDFVLDYSRPVEGRGTLGLRAAATLLETFEQQRALGAPMDDLLNQVNKGGPLKLRGNATVSWMKDDWSVAWMTNYYGSYAQSDGAGGGYLLAQGGDSIPRQLYHSISASYDFDARGGFWTGLTVEGGIRNIFDKVPPFDAYTDGGRIMYYSVFGDPRLRSAWLSVSKRF